MKLHFKLMFSPLKWLGCFLFTCIIPIVMYVPTYFDFVNVSMIYLPFVGIVLFSDVAILDTENKTEEITYLSSKKPIRVFLQRYLISFASLFIYIILANMVFRILQQFEGEVMIEPISFFEYLIIAGCASLFIGAISMVIGAIFGNTYIGYGFSVIFWLYWNINLLKESFMNPFPFIANPAFYEVPLIIIYGFSVTLIAFTCFIVRKSPFYLSDKASKLFLRLLSV